MGLKDCAPAADRLGGVLVASVAMLSYRWQAFPVAFLWAASCFVVGGLVGFLYGIPRTGRRVAVAAPTATSPASVSAPAPPVDAEL
jgi:hypothetical protein